MISSKAAYESHVDFLLGDGIVNQPKNEHWREGRIPLLSVRQHWKIDDWDYKEDVVFLPFNRREVITMLMVSQPGTNKSVLLKRICSYFYKAGYDIVVVDPKNIDFVKAKYKGNGERLLPSEEPMSLPIYAVCPSFAVMEDKDRYKVGEDRLALMDEIYSRQIQDLVTLEQWQTYAQMSESAATMMRQYSARVKTIEELKSLIDSERNNKQSEYHGSTKSSAPSKLIKLIDDQVFDSRKPRPRLSYWWKKGYIPVIHYHSRQRSYMQGDVADLIYDVKLDADKNGRPKLVILDDSNFFLDGDGMGNAAIDMVSNAINFWRTSRINIIAVTQHPDRINRTLLEEFKYLLIGYQQNRSKLRHILGDREYKVARTLIYDKSRAPKIAVEYLLKFPGHNDFATGFPLGCQPKHFG